MAVLVLPEWLLRLIPPNGELVRLSEEDYLKMDSFLGPNSPRSFFAHPNSSSATKVEAYNMAIAQLVPLREYNRKLRENPTTAQPLSQGPTTVEDAESLGYVEAKKCVELLSHIFSSTSAFTKYLDDSERAQLIRRFKPTPNRRMVHAADLINTLFKEYDAEQNAMSKWQGEEKRRRNKPGK